MIHLSPDQEERALSLHATSFIFDFVPRSEPLYPLTDAERELVRAAVENGTPAGTIRDELFIFRTRAIAEDAAAEAPIHDYWSRAGVNGVVCTLGSRNPQYDDHESIVRDATRRLRRLQVAGHMVQCRSVEDLERAFESGRVGLMFGTQDTVYLGDDLSNLDVLYDFGTRMIQLTYNSRNLIGDGCTERVQGGLTHFGVEAVRRMNELGIIVDLAHSGIQTTFDAIEVSDRPVAFSHTGCHALYAHPRNKTDEQLRALAERDGYVGIYAVPFFLSGDPDPGIETMLDHLDHAIGIVGIERVGIGTDWGSWSKDVPEEQRAGMMATFMKRGFRAEHGMRYGRTIGEMDTYTNWHHITRGLVARGYSDDEIRGFLGQNFLRFMRRAIG